MGTSLCAGVLIQEQRLVILCLLSYIFAILHAIAPWKHKQLNFIWLERQKQTSIDSVQLRYDPGYVNTLTHTHNASWTQELWVDKKIHHEMYGCAVRLHECVGGYVCVSVFVHWGETDTVCRGSIEHWRRDTTTTQSGFVHTTHVSQAW